jgi:hypothetical protein
VWKWRGGWRAAAIVPLLLILFVVGRIVIDGILDRTSHNLWPFEILFAGAAAVGFVLVLAVLRRITGTGRSPT